MHSHQTIFTNFRDEARIINDVPVTHIQLKTLGINPRRAMEQIVASRIGFQYISRQN